MNIIKRGTPKDTRLWRGTCRECESVIGAIRKELQIEFDQKEDGEFGQAVCPVCGYTMIFYPKVK